MTFIFQQISNFHNTFPYVVLATGLEIFLLGKENMDFT